ncbi:NusG domain II-containing protein [Butyrivibrio sp. MC2021]|uniref:NusG domain II-containing protein n=1 Tax=Butyrivibrio sp. MC2021 TaxID=1408306 RepID=UPI0006840548|nr:NusG domain II-containing protein [Butyrivibrio sp. MC2021]
MGKKIIGKNDIYLIGILFGVLLLMTFTLLFTEKSGNEVVVTVGGEVVKTFPLDKDTVYEIKGAGGGRNLLVIENGEAYLKEASCPDHLCMSMGRIRRVGQCIICLPNMVTVEIVGEKQSEDDYDAIVG